MITIMALCGYPADLHRDAVAGTMVTAARDARYDKLSVVLLAHAR